MNPIENQLINLIENGLYQDANSFLDKHPELIDSPSEKTASGISMLLILMGDLDACLSFASYHLKKVPSADLYYNKAYALEQLGDFQNAIVSYQCARLFTIDPDLRRDSTVKIQQLRFPELDETELIAHLEYMSNTKEFIIDQINSPKKILEPSNYNITATPVVVDKPRILYGTMEIANHMSHYIRYFRDHGYDTIGIDYIPSYLRYDSDFSYDINQLTPQNTRNHFIENAADLILDYDVFHFLFNRTLMPDGSDIIPLKLLNKTVFMHNLGSEIRIPSIARSHHPFWHYAEEYLNQLNEDIICSNLKIYSSWIDHCIINDQEMLSYVEPYYKNTHMIGLPIDLKKYPYIGIKNEVPLKFVHAPTNQSVKGSTYFESAILHLQKKYNILYQRIERTGHEDAIKQYAEADIVLDELIIGTYGSLTIECLAMGKCVVTFINPGFDTPHGSEIPVWSVNVDNIIDRLELLINSPEIRQSLSNAGRAYVEKFNDVSKIGSSLLSLYTSEFEKNIKLSNLDRVDVKF